MIPPTHRSSLKAIDEKGETTRREQPHFKLNLNQESFRQQEAPSALRQPKSSEKSGATRVSKKRWSKSVPQSVAGAATYDFIREAAEANGKLDLTKVQITS